MRFFSKLLNFTCLILAALWSVPCSLLVVFWFSLKNERLGHAMVQMWGKGWMRLMSIRVTVTNPQYIPRNQTVIYAANHESIFDVLVFCSLPIHYKWISKEQVRRVPFIGWAMRKMGTFFVKRDRSGHDINVMKEIEEGLKGGTSVVMFPEGTRTRTGELLPFKKGPFKTAQNAGIPLCPVAFTGTREIAAPGSLPIKRGHQVEVRFGPLFWVPKDMPLEKAMENFRAELVALLKESRGI